jgi:electron transport complex protein RnfC
MTRLMHPGLPLPSHKQHTRDVAITVIAAPDILILPLDQHSDADLIPCIEPGATVMKGQVIAKPAVSEDASLSAWLHAPVSGTVTAIETHDAPYQHASRSIVIRNDHRNAVAPSDKQTDWSQLQPLALCQLIARGGIAGLGGAVFPAATKLAMHADKQLEYLLINGVECEPFITCDDRLMRERAADIVRGAQIMMHAAQAQQCLIAIEADKPEAAAAMQAALRDIDASSITLHIVATAYPSGDEGQLITQLTGREIPRGGLPADIGVIVQNVATAYACARWVEHGEPLTTRIVTVAGAGVAEPGNFEVALGTSIQTLIAACGAAHDASDFAVDALIMGGAMMGRTLAHDQLPVVKATNCLIVTPRAALRPFQPELPCIRCGECSRACPVYLMPQHLLTFTRSNNPIALQELGLADCIECGCCDYVCPSNITLAARFHAAKKQAAC